MGGRTDDPGGRAVPVASGREDASAVIAPADDEARLAAVRRYGVIDTPPDRAFDAITAIAARLLDAPVAVVSIVDENRIWFKSRHGIDLHEVGRDPGLCASAILQNEPWVVTDARTDPSARANPLVAGEPGFRFYAGVPLTVSDGHNLGTICVMDAQPRLEATAALCALVQALARLELQEGYAPRELVHAQEALAENRFLAARDGVAAELIDPVRARRVPVADVLADILAAAAPHASALGAAVELVAVPALVTAPEAARQEARAAAGGVPALVSDLARRFNPAGGREARPAGRRILI